MGEAPVARGLDAEGQRSRIGGVRHTRPPPCRPRRRHDLGTCEMRPGRFELPRSKRTTRPSTLRATCPSFPAAPETPIPSGTMDDLDLVDVAFVVTVLSRARFPGGTNWPARRCVKRQESRVEARPDREVRRSAGAGLAPAGVLHRSPPARFVAGAFGGVPETGGCSSGRREPNRWARGRTARLPRPAPHPSPIRTPEPCGR